MEIEITLDDLEEIERKYDKLTSWLTSNYTSFVACAFVLQTVMDAVNEAKAKLKGEEDEQTS